MNVEKKPTKLNLQSMCLEELEKRYLKIYLRALKLTPNELAETKKTGYRYKHLEEIDK